MELIDGKKIREGLLADTQVQVASLGFQPVFCDILVGEDPVSAQYVRMKGKMAESIGIKFHNAVFPATITTEALINEIGKDTFNDRLNKIFETSQKNAFGGGKTIDAFAGIQSLYNHGNQPNLHISWLFNYSSASWLTQKSSAPLTP